MKKALRIIAFIFVIVFLIGVFFAVYKLSNNFTTDIKTFYLVMDGKIITLDTDNVFLFNKNIEIHTVGELFTGHQEFKYKIVRNSTVTSFEFNFDDNKHAFSETDDYTKGFEVELTDNSITVKFITMHEVLQRMYGDGKLELPELDYEISYFTLVVELADGSKSICLNFKMQIYVDQIHFDSSHLEF